MLLQKCQDAVARYLKAPLKHPRRYTRIVVRHVVSGEGITQASLDRAVNLSHEKYCSVSATLNAEIESKAVLQ